MGVHSSLTRSRLVPCSSSSAVTDGLGWVGGLRWVDWGGMKEKDVPSPSRRMVSRRASISPSPPLALGTSMSPPRAILVYVVWLLCLFFLSVGCVWWVDES